MRSDERDQFIRRVDTTALHHLNAVLGDYRFAVVLRSFKQAVQAANFLLIVRDLPDAEFHLLDTGHFALEDKGGEIARLMLDFLDRKLPRN